MGAGQAAESQPPALWRFMWVTMWQTERVSLKSGSG